MAQDQRARGKSKRLAEADVTPSSNLDIGQDKVFT
jgi:hypothetical protein